MSENAAEGKTHPTLPASPWKDDPETLLRALSSSRAGLTGAEAKQRLGTWGHNELTKGPKVRWIDLLVEQFKNFLIIILVLAAVLSFVTGDTVEALAIIAIVILAGVLGFVQEYRADKAIEKLREMAAPTATVFRDGEETIVPSKELVPGDIITLKTGDRIGADGRIIESMAIRVDEASLTGESHPVEKSPATPEGEVVLLANRTNMVFSGTIVVHGRGKTLVTATGMRTEFGKITGLLQETKAERTPLQVSLDQMGRWLGVFSIALSVVIASFGILKGYDVLRMLVWGVALAVAVIPEALPAVVTISLALGVSRLAKQNALIRKLNAVETLGSTSVICSDKTGTLTQGEMTVQEIALPGLPPFLVSGVGYRPTGTITREVPSDGGSDTAPLALLLRCAALCNDAELRDSDDRWRIIGDPTEAALLTAAAKLGLWKQALQGEEPRVDEVAFSSERKVMTTIHRRSDGTRVAYMKGAPEILLLGRKMPDPAPAPCGHYLNRSEVLPLKPARRDALLLRSTEMARRGLRTLGFAYRELAADESGEAVERDMVFLGFVGMMDPPREEVKDAIRECHQAGIRTVMITGDQRETAQAIARQLGILTKGGVVLSGEEIDGRLEEITRHLEAGGAPLVKNGLNGSPRDRSGALTSEVDRIQVYARVSPEHKIHVVDAFTKAGRIVAMTGDGVNDAPALKKAHIGIAMGITGTDVSKEASAMILQDDNFATIVRAVKEGRAIFSNIRKYLVFLLSGNLGTVIAMLIALLAGFPLPLAAVQILFVNMILDGIPAIALGVEPPEPDIMRRGPRNPKESIFDFHSRVYILLVGILTALITISVFHWARENRPSPGNYTAMTMFLSTLIAARLFNSLNCRSTTLSIFRLGFFSNRWLLYGAASAIALTLMITYIPTLNAPFMTAPLSWKDLLLTFAAGSIVWIAVEIAKLVSRVFEKPRVPTLH